MEQGEDEYSKNGLSMANSKKIAAESMKALPYGVSSNYRYIEPYPLYFKKGKGSYIYDADDKEYIDFNMAFGVLTAGHSHPAITEVIRDRIDEGTILGFEYTRTYELAKILNRIYGTDMIRFSSTGGEATQAAIRIARAFTGRPKILKFEGCYHGSHDGLLVGVKPQKDKAGSEKFPNPVPASLGIPENILKDVIIAPFNDIDSVEELVKRNMDKIAAVILEPVPMNMGLIIPEDNFLGKLREVCDANGILLIFDEIKTGSKHYGGASKYFGVKPDLLTLGKAIGGGYPISAVGGRKDVMSVVGPMKTSHAGTFNSNPLVVDAAIATMSKVLTEENLKKAEDLSSSLAKGYNEIIEDLSLPLSVNSWSTSGSLYFTTKHVKNWRDFLDTNVSQWYEYLLRMMKNSIIPAAPGPDEQWTVSVQHSSEDIEKHLEVFRSIAPEIKNIKSRMDVEESI